MTRQLPTPCTYLGVDGPCPEYAVDKGRCADHPRISWRKTKGGPRPYDAAWRKLAARRKRNNPICQWPECNRPATSVDHIVELADGGARLAYGNTQSLCEDHHTLKTQLSKQARRDSA